MFPVSQDFLNKIKDKNQEHRLIGTIGNQSFTEGNIVDGSFSIFLKSSNPGDVLLGSCQIGELNAEFSGINIGWSNWVGKVITPTFGLKLGDDSWEYIPLGVYKVAEANHTKNGVKVVAYDNMTKFDKKFKKSHFMNLSGMYNIISQICTDCGVTLGMTAQEIAALPNGSRTGMNIYGSKGKKTEFANDITTNRDALFWCAQTLGCFATMDRAGQLVFRKYHQNVVDMISDADRVEGATFEDYITHYIGIYVENLDDNTVDYYGYDTAALTAEMNETASEISADSDRIDELVTALAEWDYKLEHGECTQEEYDAAVAEIVEELHPLEIEVKQLTKRMAWLESALQQSGDDGSDMVLGANPLTMAANLTTRDAQRREILGALSDISYTPFSASVLCGAQYDLGDVIQFSGGLYNSDTDTFGCVMSWTYNHNGGTDLQGFGVDPSVVMIRNKTQKSTDRANQNATTAMNENDMVFDFGDNNEVIATNKKAFEQSTVTRKFKMWEHNFNEPQGYDWAKFNVSISMPYPFVICTIPDLDHGNPRYYYLDGKWRQSKITYVVAKLQQSVGDRFYLSGQSWVKYAGYFNYYNEFSNTMWKRENTLYYYSATGTGTLMYGLLDIEPDYSFNSYAELWAAMAAGTIDVPGVVPDDECTLATESSAKQAAANAEYLAEKMAGNNPTRSSETYSGNVNVMSEKTMERLSDAFYSMGENVGNITNKIDDVKVDNVSVVTSKIANINTMTGATASAAGAKGLVPTPASGDNEKFLRGDGTWQEAAGGNDVGLSVVNGAIDSTYDDDGTDVTADILKDSTGDEIVAVLDSIAEQICLLNNPEVYAPVVYSDEEREIGVWRDGKPLYQKTFNVGALTQNATKEISISDLNIETCVKSFGYTKDTTNGWNININDVTPSTINGCIRVYTNVSTKKLFVNNGSGTGNGYTETYVTIQYTKTTDVAGSGHYAALGVPAVHYSENEQVIGTWIDGKTLYEKTVVIQPTALSQGTTINHGISNIDKVVHYEVIMDRNSNNSFIDFTYVAGSGTAGSFRVFKTYFQYNGTDSWTGSEYSAIYVTVRYTKTS